MQSYNHNDNKVHRPRKETYITRSKRVFETWADEDFFGPKAQHIYFYGDVDEASVQKLRSNLHKAAQQIVGNANGGNAALSKLISKPKPIVLHVHSPGGNADLGLTMVNLLRELSIPIAVVVDGYACSAVTPMLVSAPYRVMHDLSFFLIHEGSVMLSNVLKVGDARYAINNYMSSIDQEYMNIYINNTTIPRHELEDLFTRDKFIDAQTCLQYKAVDRILTIDKETCMKRWLQYFRDHPDINTNADPMYWHNTYNHIFNYDALNAAASPTTKANLTYMIKPLQKIMEDTSYNIPKPIVFHVNQSIYGTTTTWFDTASLIIRMNLVKVPVIGVIDSNVDLIQAIPCIMAFKRYMYKNTYMHVRLEYYHLKMNSVYYHDIKSNTELLRKSVVEILRKYAKMPPKLLEHLFDNRQMLSAEECKRYGLIDEIIDPINRNDVGGSVRRLKRVRKVTSKTHVMMKGGCMCSQGLPIGTIR